MMRIEISRKIAVSDCREDTLQTIRAALTMPNPKFAEAERMGRYAGGIPKTLYYYRLDGDTFLCPRGFFPALVGIARERNEQLQVADNTRTLDPVSFKFHGKLRYYQKEACRAVYDRKTGVLCAPTGSGKTVMASAMIQARKQPTLIVVHTRELLYQWRDRIGSFLRVEAGIIGDGKMEIGTAPITVGMVQTLVKCANEVNPFVGHVIVDECHRTPSRTFSEVVSFFDCRYVLGLSATPWRRDGLSKLIYWYLGPKVHEVRKEALIDNGHIERPEMVYRETAFRTCLNPSLYYSKMLSELCQDVDRNGLIASDVAKESVNGGAPCLVLSDRKSHCGELAGILSREHGIESELLTGDVPHRERQRVVSELDEGKIKVLIATGQLVGEGFDCKELSTLFLATPIKFSGRLLQYIGRILRPSEGKRAKVYDYVDASVGVLKNSAEARRRVYGIL